MSHWTAVIYDTSNGAILGHQGKGLGEVVLSSGTCSVDGAIVSDLSLGDNESSDVAVIKLIGKRFMPVAWLSATSCKLHGPLGVSGETTYELVGRAAAYENFTEDEKAAIVQDFVDHFGHSNIDLITLKFPGVFDPKMWIVNTVTKQLASVESSIVYE